MIYLASRTDMVGFGENVIVPLFGIFCTFALPVLAFVFFRVLKHRERLEMIRNGFDPGTRFPKNVRGATASSNYDGGARSLPIHTDEAAQTTLRKGITLTFIGLAITIGLSFIGYHSEASIPLPGFAPTTTTWEPGPWLLGGLVPMFVGLAQVVIALLSGATLRPLSAAPASGPTERVTPSPPIDNVTYDGPYTYRPGDTQELRPPKTPPERRF